MAIRRPVYFDASTEEFKRFGFSDLLPILLDFQVIDQLALVRGAITRFYALNGAYPGAGGTEASFKYDLSGVLPYIGFPVSAVPPTNDSVKITGGTFPIVGDLNPVEAWHYAPFTGQFIHNGAYNTLLYPSNLYEEL